MHPHSTFSGEHTTIPRNNRELIAVRGPKETFLGLSKTFQLHRELSFANFVVRESLRRHKYFISYGDVIRDEETNLQLVGQADLFHSPDEPFGGIVLVPLDGIPVVHGELVMEIVITLSDGDKSSDHMIAGRVLVVKRSLAEPMSERVDTEGRLPQNR